MARLDTSYFESDSDDNGDGSFYLLKPGTFQVREAGLEFWSEKELEIYTELHLQVESPEDGSALQFSGVVVDCSGNKHCGFRVSLLYTSINPSTQLALYERYWAEI